MKKSKPAFGEASFTESKIHLFQKLFLFTMDAKVYLFGLCLILISVGSCSPSIPEEESSLKLDFTVNAFDLDQNSMNVTFHIKNASDLNFDGGNWSLHWTQMGGMIDESTLPEGLSFERVNGHYYILEFGPSWDLTTGKDIQFTVDQFGIMNRLIMGPLGVFVVDAQEKTYDLVTNIHWENAKGLDQLGIPTAAQRYYELEEIFLLPESELDWIVPTPKIIHFANKYRSPETALHVYLDPAFAQYKEQFHSTLRSLPLNISWTDRTDANLILEKIETGEAEGYQLDIAEQQMNIRAETYAGIFYGLQSLQQVLQVAEKENDGWPILSIVDGPRFPYRGFLLDVSRNYYGLEKIKQLIDYLGFFKINHLDLRLTDDEGWRIEIPGLPELTETGANRGYSATGIDRLVPAYGSGADGGQTGNGFISREEFIELLEYASARNIKIIPQVSFPSHARAAIKAMNARYVRLKEEKNIEEATAFLLHDPDDQSTYISAQAYDDNIICICQESAYHFFEKVVYEIRQMYEAANQPFEVFSVGADELPYGAWSESPLCDEFLKENDQFNTINALYDYNLHRLKNILSEHGATLAGWEDILLDHSEKSQGETLIKAERFNYEVIPYVWNNIWGEGREDMIYKFANLGFKTIMSNSAAFYFDMTDDKDIENYGLNWSGYVNYKDSWGVDPVNVFANLTLNDKHGITPEYISQTEKIQLVNQQNLLGIQSQLWTETVVNADILDELFMPNLPVFAERAWAPQPSWTQETNFEQQRRMINSNWNRFSNTLGQRILPQMESLFGGLDYDLPKPGAIIEEDTLKVKVKFPGLDVHFTTDGAEPTVESNKYESPIPVKSEDLIILRTFDSSGRGGRTISIKQS